MPNLNLTDDQIDDIVAHPPSEEPVMAIIERLSAVPAKS